MANRIITGACAAILTLLTSCSAEVPGRNIAEKTSSHPAVVTNLTNPKDRIYDAKYARATAAVERWKKKNKPIYCGSNICLSNKVAPKGQFICQQFGYYAAQIINDAKIPGIQASAFAFYFYAGDKILGVGHAITRIDIIEKGKIVRSYFYDPQDNQVYSVQDIKGISTGINSKLASDFFNTYHGAIQKSLSALEQDYNQCTAAKNSGGLKLHYISKYYPDSWLYDPLVCPAPKEIGGPSRPLQSISVAYELNCPDKPTPHPNPEPAPVPAPVPIPEIDALIQITSKVDSPCSADEAPHIQCTFDNDISPIVHLDRGTPGSDTRTLRVYKNTPIKCTVDEFDPSKHRVGVSGKNIGIAEYPQVYAAHFIFEGPDTGIAKMDVQTICQQNRGHIAVEIKKKFYNTDFEVIDRSVGYVSSNPAGISCGNAQNSCATSCLSTIMLTASEVTGRGKFLEFRDRSTGEKLCNGKFTCQVRCSLNLQIDAVYSEPFPVASPIIPIE